MQTKTFPTAIIMHVRIWFGTLFQMGVPPRGRQLYFAWGLFRKVHYLEILEDFEILEFLENLQAVEKKARKPPFVMTPFSGSDKAGRIKAGLWDVNSGEI